MINRTDIAKCRGLPVKVNYDKVLQYLTVKLLNFKFFQTQDICLYYV